jgi:starch phosphorylase
MADNHYLLEVEVKPNIPPQQQSFMHQFSKDLIYSWHDSIRNLFIRLDKTLWDDFGHSPSVFLRRIEQHKLEQATSDPTKLQNHHNALTL